MKDVQCYELFGGIALKNHAFSFFIIVASPFIFHVVFAKTFLNEELFSVPVTVVALFLTSYRTLMNTELCIFKSS